MPQPPAPAPSLSQAAVAFLAEPASKFTESLDQLHKQVTEEKALLRLVAGSASFVSLGMSVVYILWTLRAGYVLASLLSSMPAWQFIDPLPILDDPAALKRRNRRSGSGNDEDDSLEDLIERGSTTPASETGVLS